MQPEGGLPASSFHRVNSSAEIPSSTSAQSADAAGRSYFFTDPYRSKGSTKEEGQPKSSDRRTSPKSTSIRHQHDRASSRSRSSLSEIDGRERDDITLPLMQDRSGSSSSSLSGMTATDPEMAYAYPGNFEKRAYVADDDERRTRKSTLEDAEEGNGSSMDIWLGGSGSGGSRRHNSTSSPLLSLPKLRLWQDAATQKIRGLTVKKIAAILGILALVYAAKLLILDLANTSSAKLSIDRASRYMPSNVFKWSGHPSWHLPATEKLDSASPLVRTQPPREIDLASEALPLETTLSERLAVWAAAPGGRGPGIHHGLDGEHHEEVELGTFNSWNLESCSGIDHQMNTHMIQKSANVWGTLNRTSLWETRMSLIEHMKDLEKQGTFNSYGEGRGIVMVAGNADTLRRVKWSVAYMRERGTTLPVQVFHFPSEKPNGDDPIVNELRDLGVELVEAQGQQKDEGKSKSYHLKALAVVQCPWREVLYLDSDSIPVRDPEYMFDAPSYHRLKIWATPDYWKTSANNAIWAILGIRCRDEWEMETGQIFVDKKHHLDVFMLIKYMLEHHDYFFYFSDGDKDIFRWALLALRKRWGVPGRWVGAAALPAGTASGDFCAHTMLQHDAWGQPLFVHYNLLKQIPSGVGRGFSWGRTKQMPLFNSFPASPSTAREGEFATSDNDVHLKGLGDVDCDMLADADAAGNARAPAREEVRRRAARERGIKVRYHGGVFSALCIDIDWDDPRPESVRKADEAKRDARNRIREEAQREYDEQVKISQEREQPIPEMPSILRDDAQSETGAVQPDWSQSPLEVVWWNNDQYLNDFESKLYDLGFVPNGPGF